MSLQRSTLIGGAAGLSIGGTYQHLLDDAKMEFEGAWSDLDSAIYGKTDEISTDLLIKLSGTPLTWASATSPALILPYIGVAPGTFIPGSADTPVSLVSNNGDTYTAVNAVQTKLPDMTFGGDKPLLGALEFTGIIGNGLDPETTASYYSVSTGSYTPVALDLTKVPRGKYTWVWGTASGFATSVEFEEPPVLSWDLKLEAIKVQGRTRAYRLQSLLAMLKGKPIGPTGSQILAAAQLAQASGAVHGHRASVNAATLVGTGPIGVTVNNAALKSAGFVFGNKALRNGEIGFLSTLNPSSGTVAPIVAFS